MGYVRECGIVFLDINMEGMDGLEAAGRIKAEFQREYVYHGTGAPTPFPKSQGGKDRK